MKELSEHFETFQATVDTTAIQISDTRISVDQVTIENLTATPVFIGGPNVDTTSGFAIPGVVGASLTLRTTDAIFAISTGTATLCILRTFG